MATSRTLFREYILLRLRAVMYATLILTIILSAVLIFLASSSENNVNRTGLILQFLAGLAIIPELIGKGRLQRSNGEASSPTNGGTPGSEINGASPRAMNGILLEHQQNFDLYLAHNRPLVAGNLVVSLWLMGFLVALAFYPQPDITPFMTTVWSVVSLTGFAWVNLIMLIFIYRIMGSSAPDALQRLFFFVDFVVSIPGLFFAAAFYLASNWVWAALRFVYQDSPLGPRRVLLMVSLPFFLIGTLLIFIATF